MVRTREPTILAKRTKRERQLIRRAAGTLRSLQLQPRTINRYEAALGFFFAWLEWMNLTIPNSPTEADEVVADFIEDAWLQGEAKSVAGDVLSGLQHFAPMLRRGLPDSWRLYGTWSRQEVPSRARPLLPDQVLAMAGFALFMGEVGMAALLLIAFNGMLRPSEAFVTSRQCSFDLSRGLCHIDLGLTKSGKRFGISEHVIIDELEGVVLLGRVLAGQPAGAQLFPGGHARFRKLFSQLVGKIGARPDLYKPYSLRRGGATHHWRTLGNLGQTTVRGRWRHQITARIYLQEGGAILDRKGLSQAEKSRIKIGISHLRRLV